MTNPSLLKDECYTPSYFVDPIRELWGGFHLDPFSSKLANQTINSQVYLDKETDGLRQSWLEMSAPLYPTFWVNPPYSRGLIQHCIKKTLFYVGHAEIFLLVNSQTSSRAYRSCVKQCDGMLFPEKRIQFINPNTEFSNSNDRDQTLFYFGRHKYRLEQLSSLGEVITR